MLHAFSIDLEEWYDPELLRRRGVPTTGQDRAAQSVAPLLALLDRHGVRATVFVVGRVAERDPELLQRIHAAGHEVGFHGMSHRPLWELDPASFEAEIVAFRALIDRVLGPDVPVRGFRAPTFSLDARTRWALPLLARHGYRYDASLVPAKGPLYGMAGAPLAPYRVNLERPELPDPESPLVEWPATVVALGKLRAPAGGGFYLRALPSPVLLGLLGLVARRRPIVIYVHPWETDPGVQRVELPPFSRFVTYYGVHAALGKVEALLRRFRFASMWEALGAAGLVTEDDPAREVGR